MSELLIVDFETIRNCFLACYVSNEDDNRRWSFEVSSYKNDIVAYLKFQKKILKGDFMLVTMNGVKFDSQVATYILENYEWFLQLSGEEIANKISDFAQKLIAQTNEKGYGLYKKKQVPYKEYDLAAINNYNNKAKFSSLKWLQYNMDWPEIMDMECSPFDYLTPEQIIDLKKYCYNDCYSTKALLQKNFGEIELRKELSNHFGIDLTNSSEPDISKKIFLKLLSEDLNMSPWDLKEKRTWRPRIHLKDAILPYINFKTKPLQDTLSTFLNLTLDGEKLAGSFKHNVRYRGLDITFALGGIHGAKRGDYKSGDGFIIKSFDVKSFYPNLSIRNQWAPSHIKNNIFCDRYVWFYNERLKYDKKNPLNYTYKIVLNSTYGLSNEKNSFLKDSFFTMQITCNGQLSLVMLLEELIESIPMSRPLMLNTDGGELIFPKEYEPLFYEICKKWEALTQLELEYEDYQRLVIFDVNNYIGIFKGKKIDLDKAKELVKSSEKPLIKVAGTDIYHFPTKCKGRFEIDKALHKNKSYRINRIALYNYFLHGIPPSQTITENKNIYDFCAGVRAKGGAKFVQECLDVEKGVKSYKPLPKTIRYYSSTKGCKLIKIYAGGDRELLEASKTLEELAITIDSKKPFEDYNVDPMFYLRIINKEIRNIEKITANFKLDL